LVTSLYTVTSLSWPMRWHRAMACVDAGDRIKHLTLQAVKIITDVVLRRPYHSHAVMQTCWMLTIGKQELG
jgi:hypothetical protein